MTCPRVTLAIVATCVAFVPPRIAAQLDCGNPDDVCTGDPCVLERADVPAGCALDFGARTVRIDRCLRAAGALTVAAGRIEIPKRGSLIIANGGSATLEASGDVLTKGKSTPSAAVAPSSFDRMWQPAR